MKKYFIFSLLFVTFVAAVTTNYDKVLPVPSDLAIFLKSLLNIVNYADDHINEVEINFIFGIFLTKVNLVASLRGVFVVPLPDYEAAIFEKILRGCDNLLELFNQKEREDWTTEREYGNLKFSFWNATAWTSVLPKYTIHHSVPQQATDLETDGMKWEHYNTIVNDYENGIPNPILFDNCMMVLDQNPFVSANTLRRCELTDVCYDAVKTGSDVGYALTHRLILILHATLHHRCYIDSPAEDAAMAQQFCTAAYGETVYISRHHFQLRDLFMEQISLCTLLGRPEFLQGSWLYQIISWQHEVGCFQQYNPDLKDDLEEIAHEKEEKEEKEENEEKVTDSIEEDCNGHVTAVGASALSAAVRFIIEKYYT